MNNLIPHDLLSNFLTHSYFDLLEHSCQLSSTSNALDFSKEFKKSLKSFLFIFQYNNQNTQILQNHIFKYYEPYREIPFGHLTKHLLMQKDNTQKLFPIQKKRLTFKSIRKTYHKTIVIAKNKHNYELWHDCNSAFIKRHRQLVYHHYHSLSDMPALLRAPTAADFIVKVWLCYIDSLLFTKTYDDLLSTVSSLHTNHFESSPYLLSYIHQKTTLLKEDTLAFSSFKRSLDTYTSYFNSLTLFLTVLLSF